jgi:hypothetical protein
LGAGSGADGDARAAGAARGVKGKEEKEEDVMFTGQHHLVYGSRKHSIDETDQDSVQVFLFLFFFSSRFSLHDFFQ